MLSMLKDFARYWYYEGARQFAYCPGPIPGDTEEFDEAWRDEFDKVASKFIRVEYPDMDIAMAADDKLTEFKGRYEHLYTENERLLEHVIDQNKEIDGMRALVREGTGLAFLNDEEKLWLGERKAMLWRIKELEALVTDSK